MSYRTIVVGTDGSESSLRAVDRAAAIAAQERGSWSLRARISTLRKRAAGRGHPRPIV